jgi:twitching motility two-component system response regulator PilG
VVTHITTRLMKDSLMNQLVMVIDDSLTIRKILDICLRRVGYQVQCFQDGVEALRWLSLSEAAIPALVDLNLPKMGGYEVIRLPKANPAFAQTIFVILSRHDGILDRLKGRLAGAHAYLTKPFKIDQLVAVILDSLGDTVPSLEGVMRLGEHEVASSESTTRSHAPAGVFLTR